MLKKYLYFLFLLSFLAGPSSATQWNDSLNVRTVGSWPFHNSYSVKVVTISGHQYAITGFGSGIFIIDVDTPTLPKKVSEVALTGYPIQDIAFNNNYAYLIAETSGLWIVDLSDPYNPLVKGHCPIINGDFSLKSITVYDDHAYVTTVKGLRIFNITDNENPTLVKVFDSLSVVTGVAVRDTLAYISAGSLKIANISDPTNPVIIGVNSTRILCGEIVVAGRYAYTIENMTNRIIVFNVNTPTSPVLAGSGGIAVRTLFLKDSLLLSAGGSPNLYINSIADSMTPGLIKNNLFSPSNKYIFDAEASQGYAYLAGSSYGLIELDISNPAVPIEIGSLSAPLIDGSGIVVNNTAYFPGKGLQIIDITDPTKPVAKGSWTPNYTTIDLAIKDTFAFVTDLFHGLKILNIANDDNPYVLDSFALNGVSLSIAIKGNYAYVANDSLIKIIDISDPFNAFKAGEFNVHYYTNDIVISDEKAYIANSGRGLRVLDITDPVAPVEIGFYDTPGYAQRLALSDNKAYIADGSSGLRIVDITSPSLPQEIGFCDTPKYASAVAVDSNLAYVADDSGGVRVINIEDASSPKEVGFYTKNRYNNWLSSWDWGCSAWGVVLSNHHAYVSYAIYGLQVYGPLIVASGICLSDFTCSQYHNGVILNWHVESENSAYCWLIFRSDDNGATYNEIARINANGSSSSPRDYSFEDTKTEVGKIYYYKLDLLDVNGKTTSYGPVNVTITASHTVNVLQNSPNPFKDRTAILYDLLFPAFVELDIYNIAGQLIRHLDYGKKMSGRHNAIWDGINNNSQKASPGIYFYRLRVDKNICSTKRAILIK